MAFITYPLNNIDYTAEDAELFHCTRTSGIWAEDSFPISVTGADNNVTIGTGIAWINNEEFSGKVTALKSAEVLDLGIADSIYPRIDVIAIQYNVNNNATDVVIKKGTPASNPVRPAIVRSGAVYELYLASVYRPAGATAVTASNITDLRMDETVCGLMADSVTKVDMTAIEAQIRAFINNLQNEIDEVKNLSGLMFETEWTEGGVIPVSKGGTNATTAAEARQNINFIGINPIASVADDTPANWAALGTGVAYISGEGVLTNQPEMYGYVLNMVSDSFVNQLFFSQEGHLRTYKRAGFVNDGWYNAGEWLGIAGYIPSTMRLYRTTDYTNMSKSHNYFTPFYGVSDLAIDSQSGNLTFLNKTIEEYGDRENVAVSGVLVGKGINYVQVNASTGIENASDANVSYGLFICKERNGTITRPAYARNVILKGNRGTLVVSAMISVQEGDFICLLGYKGEKTATTNVLYSYGLTQMTVSAVN